MTHVVIDTNVLVSALLAPKGNEAFLLRSITNGLMTPCVTESLMQEYVEVLTRPKFSLQAERLSDLLRIIDDYATVFPLIEAPYQSSDPKDTKFLQCAFAASADFLVTGNRRHFAESPYGSTHVVNTRELLTRLNLNLP